LNSVGQDEVAIRKSGEGNGYILQSENSGTHFGFYRDMYFSTKVLTHSYCFKGRRCDKDPFGKVFNDANFKNVKFRIHPEKFPSFPDDDEAKLNYLNDKGESNSRRLFIYYLEKFQGDLEKLKGYDFIEIVEVE
jgi:hypothetical protein